MNNRTLPRHTARPLPNTLNIFTGGFKSAPDGYSHPLTARLNMSSKQVRLDWMETATSTARSPAQAPRMVAGVKGDVSLLEGGGLGFKKWNTKCSHLKNKQKKHT